MFAPTAAAALRKGVPILPHISCKTEITACSAPGRICEQGGSRYLAQNIPQANTAGCNFDSLCPGNLQLAQTVSHRPSAVPLGDGAWLPLGDAKGSRRSQG